MIEGELEVAFGGGALTITTVGAARGRIDTKLKERFCPEDLDRSQVVSVKYTCEQRVGIEVSNAWVELVASIDTQLKLVALQSYHPADPQKKR